MAVSDDPYADVWHQGRDCTYQCGLTGRTILAYHDDRYVVMAEDDYLRLREALRRYGVHHGGMDPRPNGDGCARTQGGSWCSCGLTAALDGGDAR